MGEEQPGTHSEVWMVHRPVRTWFHSTVSAKDVGHLGNGHPADTLHVEAVAGRATDGRLSVEAELGC